MLLLRSHLELDKALGTAKVLEVLAAVAEVAAAGCALARILRLDNVQTAVIFAAPLLGRGWDLGCIVLAYGLVVLATGPIHLTLFVAVAARMHCEITAAIEAAGRPVLLL